MDECQNVVKTRESWLKKSQIYDHSQKLQLRLPLKKIKKNHSKSFTRKFLSVWGGICLLFPLKGHSNMSDTFVDDDQPLPPKCDIVRILPPPGVTLFDHKVKIVKSGKYF